MQLSAVFYLGGICRKVFPFRAGFAQVSRLAMWKGRITFKGILCPPLIRSMRILAASCPISSVGMCTVVSMGERYWAVSMSSTPMIEISSGIRYPFPGWL